MNIADHTPLATTVPSREAAATPSCLPRRARFGPATASAVVTCALFGSVVMGMTSMGQGGEQIVAQGRAATHA